MKKQVRIRRWFIVLSLTLIITFYYRNTLGDILYEIKHLPASITIISMLFSAIYYLLEGKLIQYVASRHSKEFSWNKGTEVAYISSFYKFLTMGAAAGPAEVYYIHQEGIPLSRATGMCLVKYMVHRITIVLYGIISYLLLSDEMSGILRPYRVYILLGSLISLLSAALLIAVCTSDKFSKTVIGLLRKMPAKREKSKKRIKNLMNDINMLQDESRVLLTSKKKILWIFLVNVGKQSCYYLIPALILYYRSDVRILNVIPLMAICNMLAGVIPAPSGIGSLEYVFLKLFRALTETRIAVSVILLYRFVTWLVPFIIGGVFMAFHRKNPYKR